MLLQQRSVQCPYQDTEEGDRKQAVLKSFHQGHDISDCVQKTLLAPDSVTKSEIGSGPALLMK